MGTKKTGSGRRTLAQFAKDAQRDQLRKSCMVCNLPKELAAQVIMAREQRIQTEVVRAWLEKDYGVKLSSDQMRAHSNGHHEDRLR